MLSLTVMKKFVLMAVSVPRELFYITENVSSVLIVHANTMARSLIAELMSIQIVING